MADSGIETGIVLTANDRTGPGFDSATKNSQKLQQKFDKVGDTVSKMPEKFGKAGAAAGLMGGALGTTGGLAGQAGQKMADLAFVLSAGGPLGLAIVGITASVTALAAVWTIYGTEVKNLKAAFDGLDGTWAAMNQRADDQLKKVSDLNKEIRFFGKTAQEVAIIQREERIPLTEEAIEKTEKEIKTIRELAKTYSDTLVGASHFLTEQDRIRLGVKFQTVAELENERDALIRQADGIQRGIDKGKQAIETDKETIRLTGELIRLQDEQKAAVEATARAIATKAEAAKRAADEERLALSELAAEVSAQERREKEAAAARSDRIDQRIAEGDDLFAWQMTQAQRRIDANQAEAEETVATAMSVGGAISDLAVQMVTDQENAAKHLLIAALSAAERIIQINAAVAATEAAKTGAAISGPIGASIMASIVFGLVKAYANKFEFGGVVRGGTPGRDSVVASLTPGESVRTVQQTKEFIRNSAGAGASGQAINITNQLGIQNPDELSDDAIKRVLIRTTGIQEELISDGLILRNLRRA